MSAYRIHVLPYHPGDRFSVPMRRVPPHKYEAAAHGVVWQVLRLAPGIYEATSPEFPAWAVRAGTLQMIRYALSPGNVGRDGWEPVGAPRE